MVKKIIFISILLFMSIFSVKADDITDAFNSLNEAYQLFNGSCKNYERMAIIKYADGDINKLSGGYDTIIGLDYNGLLMSFECANNADRLYGAIMEATDVVNSSDVTLSVVNLSSNIEVKTNLLVSGSKIRSEDKMTILDDCNVISLEFKEKINEYFGYFQTFCVIITVMLSIVDVYKIIFDSKVEHKKSIKSLSKRLVALAIILLIPLIINIFISLLNNYISVDAIKCLES